MGNLNAVTTLREVAQEFGQSRMHNQYLAVCETLAQRNAHEAGYDLVSFDGFYSGRAKQMTHYVMRLQKPLSATQPTPDIPSAGEPAPDRRKRRGTVATH